MIRDEKRVAVGLARRHELGTDHRAAAGAIVDDNRLPHQFAQLRGDRPDQPVGAAAGRVAHDHADLLRRIGLGRRRLRERRGDE